MITDYGCVKSFLLVVGGAGALCGGSTKELVRKNEDGKVTNHPPNFMCLGHLLPSHMVLAIGAAGIEQILRLLSYY